MTDINRAKVIKAIEEKTVHVIVLEQITPHHKDGPQIVGFFDHEPTPKEATEEINGLISVLKEQYPEREFLGVIRKATEGEIFMFAVEIQSLIGAL